ncbi:MAG: uncharacterized protein A8A55_1286 [Amphiamblys sp. WSBS2006]|nr:MAG: uncharacterized protein A8A55_1286 [Amphiamblys sp. WSBS2006]
MGIDHSLQRQPQQSTEEPERTPFQMQTQTTAAFRVATGKAMYKKLAAAAKEDPCLFEKEAENWVAFRMAFLRSAPGLSGALLPKVDIALQTALARSSSPAPCFRVLLKTIETLLENRCLKEAVRVAEKTHKTVFEAPYKNTYKAAYFETLCKGFVYLGEYLWAAASLYRILETCPERNYSPEDIVLPLLAVNKTCPTKTNTLCTLLGLPNAPKYDGLVSLFRKRYSGVVSDQHNALFAYFDSPPDRESTRNVLEILDKTETNETARRVYKNIAMHHIDSLGHGTFSIPDLAASLNTRHFDSPENTLLDILLGDLPSPHTRCIVDMKGMRVSRSPVAALLAADAKNIPTGLRTGFYLRAYSYRHGENSLISKKLRRKREIERQKKRQQEKDEIARIEKEIRRQRELAGKKRTDLQKKRADEMLAKQKEADKKKEEEALKRKADLVKKSLEETEKDSVVENRNAFALAWNALSADTRKDGEDRDDTAAEELENLRRQDQQKETERIALWNGVLGGNTLLLRESIGRILDKRKEEYEKELAIRTTAFENDKKILLAKKKEEAQSKNTRYVPPSARKR